MTTADSNQFRDLCQNQKFPVPVKMKFRNLSKILSRTYTTKRPPSETVREKPEDQKKLTALEKFKRKTVNVTVLGANTRTGTVLSTLLKQNPLVAHLYLHGERAGAIAADLRDLDTRTMVSGYEDLEVDKAIKRADIIVMMGLDGRGGEEAKACPEDRFKIESERLIELTKMCTIYAPKSIMCVCVEPVSISLPLVTNIFRKTHWYHPARIIGSVAFHQVKLCSLLAKYYNLDPSGIHVPIVGGPDLCCAVPLFSRATPLGTTAEEAETLTKEFKGLKRSDALPTTSHEVLYEEAPLSRGFAVNRFVTSVALGFLGDNNALTLGFVRSNCLQGCKYIASTLKMGSSGVEHNYGVPILTRLELVLLEQAVLLLEERDKYARHVLEASESSKGTRDKKCSTKI